MAKKAMEDYLAEIKEGNVAARVKSLEVAAMRQARVKQKKISGVLFPFPICGCSIPDSDGVVFQAMLPCDGMIVKAAVDVEGVEKIEGGATLQVELEVENDMYVRDMPVKKPRVFFDPELPVMAGTKIKVRVTSGNVEGLVWVSFLFVPEISNAKVRKILAEDT